MKGLTQRQQEVLDFIDDYHQKYGYSPSVREVAEYFSISPKGVHDHIKALRKKQFIMNHPNKPRTFVLTQQEKKLTDLIRIPMIGTIHAGLGIDSTENFDGEIELPSSLLGYGHFFALNVTGNSMIDAGIHEGDIAIIQKQNVASNGEIVAARIDDMITLKRFYLEKNRVRLKAENPDLPDIYSNKVVILGKLRKIIRDY